MAVVLMLLKAAFRRKLSAGFQYCVWFALLIRLLIPGSLDIPVSLPHVIPTTHQQVYVASDNQWPAVPDTGITANTVRTNQNSVPDVNKSSNSKPFLEKFVFNYTMAADIWFVVMTGILLYMAAINVIMMLKLKRLRNCDSREAIDLLEECRSELGISSKVTLLLDVSIKSPRLYGLINPKILISQEILDGLSNEELRYVFLHELSHIKRKDLLANGIGLVIQAVHWFNPVIWYSICKMKQDCEIACDATALDTLKPEENKKYGMTIIRMLTLMSQRKWAPGTLGFTGSYNKRRMTMITRFKKSSAKWTAVALSLLLLTGCSSFLSPGQNTKAEATAPGQNTQSRSTDSISTAGPSTDNSSDTSDSTKTAEATAKPSAGSFSDSQSEPSPVAEPTDSPKPVRNTEGQKQDRVAKDLLLNIMKLAKQGKVINCEFSATEGVTIGDVQKKWGEADKPGEWIAAAKGTYWTYSKHNMVFGINKGEEIFEIRTFDSSLKEITLSDVKSAFGKPPHDVKTNGQEIIGYVANGEHKILMVFPQPTKSNSDPTLDHYSVLTPKATVNLMADDPGRQW